MIIVIEQVTNQTRREVPIHAPLSSTQDVYRSKKVFSATSRCETQASNRSVAAQNETHNSC